MWLNFSKMSRALCIPKRSPIQVLTRLNVAWLQWSDEDWCFQHGMAVDVWDRLTFCVTWWKKVRLSLVCVWCQLQLPGVLACSCNPATWRQVLLDGLLWGFSVTISTCWSGVRTKACINMHLSGEPERSRLTKEWRKGPGGKPSSQKSPCESVVGPRQRVAGGYLPYCKPDSELFIAMADIRTHPSYI